MASVKREQARETGMPEQIPDTPGTEGILPRLCWLRSHLEKTNQVLDGIHGKIGSSDCGEDPSEVPATHLLGILDELENLATGLMNTARKIDDNMGNIETA
ncbi:MAG: hypothetical protein KGL39_40255 [Patescibacteria group bacterium]|nr:hypothetical protein [Patescibacteria group bacterium]